MGVAALVAGADGVAVVEAARGGVFGMDEQGHDVVAGELVALVEGAVEDAHVGGVDEVEGLAILVGRQVVGQGRLAAGIFDLDLAGRGGEVELVVCGQGQVDGVAVS